MIFDGLPDRNLGTARKIEASRPALASSIGAHQHIRHSWAIGKAVLHPVHRRVCTTYRVSGRSIDGRETGS